MTRIEKQITEQLDPNQRIELRLDARFWIELLTIRNNYFSVELDHYCLYGRPKDHIFNSLRTVDCWLEVAIEMGCLETDESVK